jgi:hypothetical protein
MLDVNFTQNGVTVICHDCKVTCQGQLGCARDDIAECEILSRPEREEWKQFQKEKAVENAKMVTNRFHPWDQEAS